MKRKIDNKPYKILDTEKELVDIIYKLIMEGKMRDP